MTSGYAWRRKVVELADLEVFLDDHNSNQTLALGLFHDELTDPVKIVPKSKIR